MSGFKKKESKREYIFNYYNNLEILISPPAGTVRKMKEDSSPNHQDDDVIAPLMRNYKGRCFTLNNNNNKNNGNTNYDVQNCKSHIDTLLNETDL